MPKQKWRAYEEISYEDHRQSMRMLHSHCVKIAQALGLADAEREQVSVAFRKSCDGGLADFSNDFALLISESDGVLIPDGWDNDDDAERCMESHWKAAIIEALMERIEFDAASKENLDYARSVFLGEIVHPAVVASIQ